jgi:hypothetical protein
MRTPRTWSGLAIAVVVACFAAGDLPAAAARPQAKVNPDAAVLKDFEQRVKAYLDLRNKVDGDEPTQQRTSDAAKIKAEQVALAKAIQGARAGAKQGDVFAPAIEKKFRALLRPETTGAAGAKAKADILDEKPAVPLKVNGDYPTTEPLASVPPTVLQALPVLPKGQGLEYRFVRKHMILLDTRANLIVDFLLNAIP